MSRYHDNPPVITEPMTPATVETTAEMAFHTADATDMIMFHPADMAATTADTTAEMIEIANWTAATMPFHTAVATVRIMFQIATMTATHALMNAEMAASTTCTTV